MYSGFVGPYNHHQYYQEYEPTKKLVENENYEKNVKSHEKLVENEIFNFLRQAKAEVEGILSEVPSIIPKIPSFGTSDLNMLRLA